MKIKLMLVLVLVGIVVAGGSARVTGKILHHFTNSPDGNRPLASMIFDGGGNLYGTTYFGVLSVCNFDNSPEGCGTVFEISPNGSGGWNESVLYSFQDGNNDGDYPIAGLIFDNKGNLYGTTYVGGTGTACLGTGFQPGCGTVFELSPNGSGGWNESVLYSFQSGNDGADPSGGLVFDSAGNLYGTTDNGGSDDAGCLDTGGCGTVFELSPNGSGGWNESILYSFQGGNNDGVYPGGLVFDKMGNLYGTTYAGGGGGTCTLNPPGCGTVFELSPNGSGGWNRSILYSFQGGNNDGAYPPQGGLVFDSSGDLYGTTEFGGTGTACQITGNPPGCGIVFELSPNGSDGWNESVCTVFKAT